MAKKTLAWLALIITTVVWASSLIFGKIVYADGMTPIIFVALRYTIAAPFLIVLVRFTRSTSASTETLKSKWKILFIAGVTGPFLSQTLQILTFQRATHFSFSLVHPAKIVVYKIIIQIKENSIRKLINRSSYLFTNPLIFLVLFIKPSSNTLPYLLFFQCNRQNSLLCCG